MAAVVVIVVDVLLVLISSVVVDADLRVLSGKQPSDN